MHTHLMQFSWTEDTQPSVDLGYASNDAEGAYVIVRPVARLVTAPAAKPPPMSVEDEYALGGYAGI